MDRCVPTDQASPSNTILALVAGPGTHSSNPRGVFTLTPEYLQYDDCQSTVVKFYVLIYGNQGSLFINIIKVGAIPSRTNSPLRLILTCWLASPHMGGHARILYLEHLKVNICISHSMERIPIIRSRSQSVVQDIYQLIFFPHLGTHIPDYPDSLSCKPLRRSRQKRLQNPKYRSPSRVEGRLGSQQP